MSKQWGFVKICKRGKITIIQVSVLIESYSTENEKINVVKLPIDIPFEVSVPGYLYSGDNVNIIEGSARIAIDNQNMIILQAYKNSTVPFYITGEIVLAE